MLQIMIMIIFIRHVEDIQEGYTCIHSLFNFHHLVAMWMIRRKIYNLNSLNGLIEYLFVFLFLIQYWFLDSHVFNLLYLLILF